MLEVAINHNAIHGCHPSPAIEPTQKPRTRTVEAVGTPSRVLRAGHKKAYLLRLQARIAALQLPGGLHAQEYLHHQYRSNRSYNTLRNNGYGILLFLQLLKKMGCTHIGTVTHMDIEAFIEHEQDRGLNITTVQNRLTSVKAFIRYLMRKSVIKSPIRLREITVKLPEALPRAMATEDIARLLVVIDDIRDRAMILVLLRTGMRIGELLQCKLTDVCLPERKILIFEGEKNCLGRSVCLSDDACQALEQWLRQRESDRQYLFYTRHFATMSYTWARKTFISYLEKAGLAHKGYTLHSLRHSFATELLNAGMPIQCLQQLLGHTNVEVTRRYARLSDRTREHEYFKAMAHIEQEAAHESNRLDHRLPQVAKAEELRP